ncbi:DnaJ subfamily C member 13 isoform 1 [Schistosoma japonicum]|uniref:DnaJ subfamily C member 13 isoform 1 n=2 Tax=Schistosoma japonicum TaxID=6182 RepID=A0A4Z2CXL8_SCHJA|nr:DnaJ subfamily C member 13 isoform 1 [Schistosoma japonicum]
MPSDMRRGCMQKNRELSCYLLTKMSWKGSYKRLFTIGTLGVTTYNKDTLRVTNQWTYEEIYEIKIDLNTKSNQPHLKRFIMDILDINRKRHELTFATEFRIELLTDLLHFRDQFIKENKSNVRIHATKVSWSESVYDVILDIGPVSIDVRNPRNGELWKTYAFKDIECISKITDIPNSVAIVHGGFGHIHVFLTREPDNLIKEVNKSAHTNLFITFSQPSSPLTRDYCTEYRLGKISQDHLISQAEFTVQKFSVRYGATSQMKTVSRLMCLTESLLLERDPISYRPISAHPLCEIHLLVRDRFQPQRFSIEYVRGQIATYYSTDRDALLASLLDGVRASGNRDVCVCSSFSDRSLRFIPLINSATEEIESVHLRFLRQRPEGVSFWEAVQRFNANIAYSGLLHAVTQDGVFAENKEKLIKDALITILTQDTRIVDINPLSSVRRLSSSLQYTADNATTTTTPTNNANYELILIEAQFHALRRLVASKAGFNAFTQLPGVRVTLGQLVVNALKRRDDAVTHSVLDAINTLMHPMHDQPDIRQEQLNKASIMSSETFLAHLVDIFTLHSLRGSGSLVLCALLDFFTYGVCLPYSETSEGGLFDNLLRLLANRGRALFRLYHHPSLAIVRGAGMIMRALIEEGGVDVAKELRNLALTEGALLHHFWTACFTQGKDPRSLAVQQLSRQLVALWSENNQDAWDLLKRMLPLGLLSFLESTEEPPVKLVNMLPDRDNLRLAHEHMIRIEERKQTISYQLETKIDDLLTHWRLRVGLPIPKLITKPTHLKEAEERPVVLRRPRHLLQSLRGDVEKCKPAINWRLFFYQFQQDHAKADLIWTIRTRNELREAIEKELQEFQQERNYFSQSRLEESDLPDIDRSEPVGTGQPKRVFPIGLTNRAQSTPDISRSSSNGIINENTSNSQATADNHPNIDENHQIKKLDDTDIQVNQSKIHSANDHDHHAQTLSRSSDLSRKTRASVSPTRMQADRLINQASLVSWNYREFKVNYPSLIEEPRVGNYFLRLLLEEDRHLNDDAIEATTLNNANLNNTLSIGLSRICDSTAFFNELFRRYLQYVASDPFYSINDNLANCLTIDHCNLTQNTLRRLTMRCLCLHAMSVVYNRCHDEIGPITDIPLLTYLLDRTTFASERDCLLLLLEKLMLNKSNVMSFVDADGVRVLVDLACLAHLHTNRAPTPFQSNVLKASSEQEFSGSGANTQREWWYINTNIDRTTNQQSSMIKPGSNHIHGPVSFNELQQLIKDGLINSATKVYAQGLDSAPRCRPDGYLAEDDYVDIKEDACLNRLTSSSSQSHETPTNNETSTLDPSEQISDKTIVCGMYGWVPVKRVVQIRWTTAIDKTDMNLLTTPSVSTFSNPSIPVTGNHDLNIGCLIDKLSYNTGGMFTNYTSLSIKCVDILRRLCDCCSSRDIHGGVVRPLPKPRRMISDMNCLPHIIQLLLTFDPPLVERVVSLLHAVMDQNPFLPRLYLTGIFYFILLYTGSNVLPIARFLKDVHLLQALRLDEFTGSSGVDLASRSILGNMLPDAMIAYLENHPPEKFAEIFLGDFDSPEAIWNSEMRRYMINRITSHLADFSPRLHSNIRAIYRFIGMPIIIYPQLENELFCHNYYLRHLCDTQRFPDWPIRDPVALLRDILKTWRDELQKKPVNMSYDEALGELGLDASLLNASNEESFIRRAYYQMSMKYHPDKNPNGREKFQSIKKAYQFLCNRSKLSRGPNRLHIQLMLRAQSIVYKRYRSLLVSEKYAGYPMLVATIVAEIADDKLFSYGAQQSDQAANTDGTNTANNSESSTFDQCSDTVGNTVLLIAATELTYETVVTSVLNAEELRRENGIPVLQKAFSQCSNLLSRTSSRPGHIVVEVCGHIVSVLAAASLFPSSRQTIQETPQLLKDTLRLLYYKNLPQLCCITAACIASFCIDYWLCVTCYEYGGLFLLLQHVFAYDFTLEEASVEINEDTNSQVVANRLALLSLWAIGRMVNGYAIGREITEDGYLLREGPSVMDALSRLLTPHLARKILELNVYDSSPVGRLGNGMNDSQILHDFPLDTPRGKYLRSLAKLLTTNSITPYLIWDNRCRAELETLIDLQVVRLIKTGECNLNSVLSFTHESYAQELLIGEVFVRLYNKQPAYSLDDPKGFIIDLFQFLTNELQNLHSENVYTNNHLNRTIRVNSELQFTPMPEHTVNNDDEDDYLSVDDTVNINNDGEIDWGAEATNITNQCVVNVISALEALTNVIRHNTGLEIQCIGHFPLLFSSLDLHEHPEIQLRALDVLQAVSTNPQCLEDIAASHLLASLVMLFLVLPRAHLILIQTMEHLISSSLLLKEFIYSGGLIYLMELICHSSKQQIRHAAVHLISHCLTNKQFGRRIQAIMKQYLPSVFVDTIKDQPETFLALFDADHENPEVIWDSNMRSILAEILNEQAQSFYNAQLDDRNIKWNLPDSFKVPYTEVISKKANEENSNKPNEIAQYVACLGPIQIAGVYLHLYISHPGWTLRHPELFLNEIMEKWIEAIHQLPDSTLLVRLLTRSCKTVLTDRPGLIDSLPRSGNVHRILELLAKVNDPEGAKAIVVILHQMSASKLCVQSMSESDMIGGLIRIVNQCIGEELGLIGETLFCLFNTQYSDPLIEQALKHDLIGFVLRMLQSGFPSSVREPGQTRAYLIKALKAMQYSTAYGAKVTSILETYPNWADYRDQGHALFIANVPQSMTTYLTAGPASGSLHSGYIASHEVAPPPLSKPYP